MLSDSLNHFLDSSDKVAVIKGQWGVGKTYYWENHIKQKIEEKKVDFDAYSYISLFGKSNLYDLRKSIFHSAKPIISKTDLQETIDAQIHESNRLLGLLPWYRETKSKVT